MTYYASQHGAGRRNTDAALKELKEFKSGGALWATKSASQTGRLSQAATELFYAERNSIDYTVYSYGTPIAWHTPEGWTIVSQKFSSTTGRHQSLVRGAIGGTWDAEASEWIVTAKTV